MEGTVLGELDKDGSELIEGDVLGSCDEGTELGISLGVRLGLEEGANVLEGLLLGIKRGAGHELHLFGQKYRNLGSSQ